MIRSQEDQVIALECVRLAVSVMPRGTTSDVMKAAESFYAFVKADLKAEKKADRVA